DDPQLRRPAQPGPAPLLLTSGFLYRKPGEVPMTTSLDPRVTEATVLRSTLDTAGEQYLTNRAAQLALLEQLEEQLDLARVRGGAMNPWSLKKVLRALEIARVNRLPVINLVESGGADLPTQSELFVPAGKIFHDLTELSAMGVPTIALVFGNSTAGGAYVPG